MAGKQKSDEETKKIKSPSKKCARYKQQGEREINKVKNFIKHNIPSNASESQKQKLINDFNELEKSRK